MRVSLDANGTTVEDVHLLQPIKDTQHINMVELKALLKLSHIQVENKGDTNEHRLFLHV